MTWQQADFELWEHQGPRLTVRGLLQALAEAPPDAEVVLGFYDGTRTAVSPTVNVAMETRVDGAQRLVLTAASISPSSR